MDPRNIDSGVHILLKNMDPNIEYVPGAPYCMAGVHIIYVP